MAYSSQIYRKNNFFTKQYPSCRMPRCLRLCLKNNVFQFYKRLLIQKTINWNSKDVFHCIVSTKHPLALIYCIIDMKASPASTKVIDSNIRFHGKLFYEMMALTLTLTQGIGCGMKVIFTYNYPLSVAETGTRGACRFRVFLCTPSKHMWNQ